MYTKSSFSILSWFVIGSFSLLLLSACSPAVTLVPRSSLLSSAKNYKATAIVEEDDGAATILYHASGESESFVHGEAVIVDVGDILTVQEGHVIVTYFDGHTTRLSAGAKIEILTLTATPDKQKIKLYQSLGASLNQIDEFVTGEVEFDVETDSSMATVRGTEFDVQICGPDQTFYQAFEGLVQIDMDDQSTSLPGGFQLLATEDEPFRVLPLPVAPTCADSRAAIEFPLDGQYHFSSSFQLYGTANHEKIWYYKVEYKPVGTPDEAYSFLYSSSRPVSNGLLADIELTDIPTGDYIFRLMVVDKTGNYPEPCTITVYLDLRHQSALESAALESAGS